MLLQHAQADRELARRALELAASTSSAGIRETLERYAAELQQRARKLEGEAAEAAQSVSPPDAAPERDSEPRAAPPPADMP